MCLASLVLHIRINVLTFKFLTTSATHNLAYGLLILLQLPSHLLTSILKGKNTVSSLLTLTICGLTLHSCLFSEIQIKIFTLFKVNKKGNPVKKHHLINSNIMLYNVILFH